MDERWLPKHQRVLHVTHLKMDYDDKRPEAPHMVRGEEARGERASVSTPFQRAILGWTGRRRRAPWTSGFDLTRGGDREVSTSSENIPVWK